MTTAAARPGLPLTEGLATAAWFGLLTGYGELAYQAVRKYHLRLFLFQSPDVVWLTPLAEAGLFAGITLLGYALFGVRGRRPTAGHVFAWCAALAGMALLFLLPPLHKGAAALVAVGFGTQLGRSGLALAPWRRLLIRRTLPLLAGTVVVIALALLAARRMSERRAFAALAAPSPGAPNVLLIILDTVRAFNLSLYGYGRPTTPALEQRAATAVRFERAFSTASWSLPSHASIFTGLDAHELATDWYVPLDDTTPTLAEALRDRGWRTGGFVANLPYTSRETGLDRGFVRYEDHPLSPAELAASSSIVRAIATNHWLREQLNWHQLLVSKPAPEISRAFLRWVDQAPGRPFFAFLNYYDAHKPVVPPEPWASQFLPPGIAPQPDPKRRKSDSIPWDPALIAGAVGSYDGAIAYLDAELDRLLRALEQRGLLQNTIVILTSDHGEEFAEHGLIDHGNSLYRPSVQVPLVLWWPGRLPGGRVVQPPVSNRDLPATITDLLGLTAEVHFPGRSLARFWTAGADTTPDPIFAEVRHAPRLPAWYPSTRGDMISVLVDGLRYIRNGDGVPEVYDVDIDPEERTNLAADTLRLPTMQRLRRMVDSARPMRR